MRVCCVCTAQLAGRKIHRPSATSATDSTRASSNRLPPLSVPLSAPAGTSIPMPMGGSAWTTASGSTAQIHSPTAMARRRMRRSSCSRRSLAAHAVTMGSGVNSRSTRCLTLVNNRDLVNSMMTPRATRGRSTARARKVAVSSLKGTRPVSDSPRNANRGMPVETRMATLSPRLAAPRLRASASSCASGSVTRGRLGAQAPSVPAGAGAASGWGAFSAPVRSSAIPRTGAISWRFPKSVMTRPTASLCVMPEAMASA